MPSLIEGDITSPAASMRLLTCTAGMNSAAIYINPGALFNEAPLTIRYLRITNCDQGGILVFAVAYLFLSDLGVSYCTADVGGGLRIESAHELLAMDRLNVDNCQSYSTSIGGGGVSVVGMSGYNGFGQPGSASHLRDSTFTNNVANGYGGGGVLLAYGGDFDVTNCVFQNNDGTGSGGGGLEVQASGGNFLVVNTDFLGNGQNLAPFGGGLMFVSSEDLSITIDSCDFLNNNGLISGLLFYGALPSTTIVVANSLFKDNTAQAGTTAEVTANILMDSCTFEDNNCSNTDCALMNYVSGDSTATFRNTLYWEQGASSKVMLLLETDAAAVLDNSPAPNVFCGTDQYAPPFAIQCIGTNTVTLKEGSGYKGIDPACTVVDQCNSNCIDDCQFAKTLVMDTGATEDCTSACVSPCVCYT